MNKKLLLPSFFCFIFSYINTGIAQTFTSSNLPIVKISTGGQNIQPYQEYIMSMGIIDKGPGVRNYINDAFNNYNGLIQLELHGQSTLNLPKKSYNITPVNSLHNKIEVSFMGFPADKDWIFKGVYQDKTLLRDELAFRMYNQMGHYSSRIRYFELMVDTTYMGVYQLEEKISRSNDRVNIAKLTDTDISGDALTGGYIISLDKWNPIDNEGWYSNYNSNISHDSACFYIYKYPKPDSMPQVQKDYIKNYVNSFEAVFSTPSAYDPVNGYNKYIDVYSFIDNFILNELAKNTDGYRSSTYFYKDKDSKGGKLTAAPAWDYNIAFDNCSFNGGNNSTGWQFQVWPTKLFVPFWWWELWGDPEFKNKLKCRYAALRASILDVNNIKHHIDSMALYLDESQKRNFIRWPILGQTIYPNPTPVPPDYAGEIGKLKYWFQARINWLDANLPGLCQVGIKENSSEDNFISAYPNPFTKNFTVDYNLKQSAKIKIELINLLGEVVESVYEGNKVAGFYQDEIHTEKLATGVYMIRFTTNEHQNYKKIVKAADN